MRQTFSQFGCDTQGDRPTQVSQNLRALIQSLSNDPDCQGSVVGNLTLLEDQIGYVSQYQDVQKRIAAMDARNTDLVNQMMVETDAGIRAGLKSTLSSNQVELAVLRTELEQKQNLKTVPYQKAIVQLSDITRNVIDSSINNKRCFMKRSTEFSQILTIVGTVAATVTAVNPVLSVGIAAGTKLVDYAASKLRFRRFDQGYQRLMRDEFDRTVSCAINAMAEDYCRASDQMRILKRKISDPELNPTKSTHATIQSMGRLIEFSRTEIPRIRDWLTQVASQSSTSDSFEAARRVSVEQQAFQVRIAEITIPAVIVDAVRDGYNELSSDKERWTRLKNLVDRLFNQASGDNPLFGIYPNDDTTRYLMVGVTSPPKDRLDNRIDWHRFTPFEYSASVDYSINNLRARFMTWIDLAKNRVEKERAAKTQTDPQGVIVSGLKDSRAMVEEGKKVTPYESLEAIRDAFKGETRRTGLPNSYLTFYNDSIARIERVLKILDDVGAYKPAPVVVPSPPPAPEIGPLGLPFPTRKATQTTPTRPPKTLEETFLDWIGDIYTETKLSMGTSFLSGRMDFLVRTMTLNIYQDANAEDREIAAMFYASRQVSDQLSLRDRWGGSDSYGRFDDEALLNQASSYIVRTKDNAKTFIQMFRKEIKRSLKDVSKRIKELKDIDELPNLERRRVEICFGLWLNEEWPKGISMKHCLGAQPTTLLVSEVPLFDDLAAAAGEIPFMAGEDGRRSPKIMDKYKSVEGRICALHQHRRMKRIRNFGGIPTTP